MQKICRLVTELNAGFGGRARLRRCIWDASRRGDGGMDGGRIYDTPIDGTVSAIVRRMLFP